MTDKRGKILIVDDVSKNIQLIANLLKETYDLAFALDGKQAVSQALNNEFDLILLDIMMPEMDGFQVCELLKNEEKTKDTPIIFLTAKTDTESITRGFELGGVDYITKPFNALELKARVKTHLQLKKSREALMEKNRALEEMNTVKDKFFSIVSHDLKSPFNTFLSLVRLMEMSYDEFDEEERKDCLESISTHSEKLYKLLNNLLQWSMHQKGEMKVCPEKLFLESIVRENLSLYKESVERKKLQVKVRIEEGLYVVGDPDMMDTVFRNFLSNAIKFSNQRGLLIVTGKGQNGKVEISIEDTGIGIREEQISNLFRLDQVRTTKGTEMELGTGLGLILCDEFVRFHQGEINVESEKGKGTKVHVTLPKTPEFSPKDIKKPLQNEDIHDFFKQF